MGLMLKGVSKSSKVVTMPAASTLCAGITNLYRRADLAPAVLIIAGISFLAHVLPDLTHLTGRRQPSAESDAAILPALFAVLVAEATNLGLATMANSSGIPLHELEAAYDWYFREETLRTAIHHLITYHGMLPLTSRFGDGKTSSYDGIRFGMAASNMNARHNRRFLGMRRGVTLSEEDTNELAEKPIRESDKRLTRINLQAFPDGFVIHRSRLPGRA